MTVTAVVHIVWWRWGWQREGVPSKHGGWEGLKVCTQSVRTHTLTHIHSLPMDFLCSPLGPSETSQRNKFPATPDPRGETGKVSTAYKPRGAGIVRGQALQEHRLRAGQKHSSPLRPSPWAGVLTNRCVGLTPRKPDITAQKAGPPVY